VPKNKVLILTNPLNHEGGVVNYYNLFFKHFESNTITLKHGSIGSRAYLFYYPFLKRLLYPFYYVFDVIAYILKLIFNPKIKIVQVSPSLIPVPLIRDGLLILLAKLFGKKVVVFYRGWKLPTFNRISKTKILRTLFNNVFQKQTLQVVLASSFKDDLMNLNPKNFNEVMVTTTAIDNSQIIKPNSNIVTKPIKVLFLGRIQNLKGVEELIDAIGQLKANEKLNEFKFSIVGHENKTGYINELKKKLESYGVSKEQADFLGRITGQKKYQLYARHDVYVLPSYTEGCPNSVLEALASGLFCVTTPVGALKDLINAHNGVIIPVKNVIELYKTFLIILENKALLKNRKDISGESIDKFDIRNICEDFNRAYNKLLN